MLLQDCRSGMIYFHSELGVVVSLQDLQEESRLFDYLHIYTPTQYKLQSQPRFVLFAGKSSYKSARPHISIR